uniref:MADF domain-containing protein n=1 Tax=Glossina brevipalpis TaxID=37001 RepID=A0A1A9WU49_9MUSC
MSTTMKRKRGRPRLDEPREFNDFDLNLIQEFKKHPVFYDRTHPEHRNREYTDRIWQRIAVILNSTMNQVKTRIHQLRNRYSLEKRRAEALQQHDNSATPQWCLYKYLTFLNDYIKTRRPYSFPTSVPENKASLSSSDAEEETTADAQMILNGHSLSNENYHLPPPNLNNLPQPSRGNNVQATNDLPTTSKDNGQQKFKAFGQFLTSCLIEMDEMQALDLIEKFTIDLVKTFKLLNGQKTETTRNLNIRTTQESDSSQPGSDS